MELRRLIRPIVVAAIADATVQYVMFAHVLRHDREHAADWGCRIWPPGVFSTGYILRYVRKGVTREVSPFHMI